MTVHTSDVQDANTDADVSLVMYSASGKQFALLDQNAKVHLESAHTLSCRAVAMNSVVKKTA